MQFHLFRLRFRRRLRTQKRNVERLSLEAEEQLEERFFKRLNRLTQVRRFIALWVVFLLFLLAAVMVQLQGLSGYFQTLQAVPGGIYNEGLVGSFTTANPIYATSPADVAVSHLIFAGLLKYDDKGQLAPALAESWSNNDRGTVYTVKLRPGLTWQDGQPLTAADAAYTFQLIQNPDAQSPLISSWRNIKVAAVDNLTVTFTLPGAFSSFPYSLTTGLVPAHLLKSITPQNLRSADFNTAHPVGAGPFAFQALQVSGDTANTRKEQVAMIPFAHYYGGQPKLDQFVVHVYRDQDRMIQDYRQKELTAMAGLASVPDGLAKDATNQISRFQMAAANMAFFRTSSGVLADKTVRQALVAASDPAAIIWQLGLTTPRVNEPLLQGQLGYDPAYAQVTGDPNRAASLLDAAGWKVGPDGMRSKDGKPLQFSLRAQDTPEENMVTGILKQEWRQVGVNVQIELLSDTDLQSALTYHDYDALLYGITIGPDPDVFAYWHSSQADVRSANRLNLSEYKSAAADAALEAGRARDDPVLRVAKYKAFLQAWQSDAPALGLYQPQLLYIAHVKVKNLVANNLVSPADRYADVQTWLIRQGRVTNQ